MYDEVNLDNQWNRFSSNDNERIDIKNLFNESIETDVPGLFSDSIYRKGTESFPCFDVSKNKFFGNMEQFRKRISLDGKAAEYLRATRYSKPFYIRYTDENNKVYVRKIK